MKSWEAIAIMFIVICLSTLVIYNLLVDYKTNKYYESRNKICAELTSELQKKTNDTATCMDYYCYYLPSEIPAQLKNTTQALCICDCMQKDNTILRFQVLTKNSTS